MMNTLLMSATLLAVAVADDLPMTISASHVGRFKGASWYLSVNSAGQAELTLRNAQHPIRRAFEIPKDELLAFRRSIQKEGFFDLKEKQGGQVPDGSTQSLTVTIGDRSKTVKVHFLANLLQDKKNKEKLREPARAVRLMILVRGWFADADAADATPLNQKVLDALEEE
ncbi:MAG TPA: hypothetical protein VND64_22765 [Pirellulales bacterium]|nr:hypothetical protein [Pirellulales bacterium]